MGDDWRLSLVLSERDRGFSFMTSMKEVSLESEAHRRLGDRVAVSTDGPRIFLYASSQEAAREAEQVVRGLLRERDLTVEELRVERWHPEEERWEDATVPLPDSPEAVAAEHRRRMEEEAARAAATGEAEWEVRVELPDRHRAAALAEQLKGEGLDVVRRFRYLLVGAVNEDAARALAERLRAEAGRDAEVDVELSASAVMRAGPTNPFALFGGLGG